MNPNQWLRYAGWPLVLVLMMPMVTASAGAEWKEKVLYSFQGGSDGQTPAGGVVFDKAGNLYGVTNEGGSTCPSPGCGTVFQLAPPTQKGGSWTESILYGFNGTEGSIPVGGAIIDGNGNLYGTTAYGGSGTCLLFGDNVGCGVVYELSPPTKKGGQWTYTVLYNFQGGKDGLFPWGDLVFDKNGNLYGATQFGGGKGTTCNQYFDGNCGTVFELSPPKQKGGAWKEKILHSFAGGTDGANPNGGLIFGGHVSIYGTTFSGGGQSCHCYGTVFELLPPSKKAGDWTEKQLHVFAGGTDGGQPSAGVIFDAMGSLYGVAGGGNASGGGIVFRLTLVSAHWKKTVLQWFSDNDEGPPLGGLIFDSVGNLYGTTTGGNDQGTVFRLNPPKDEGRDWTLAILHTFTGIPDGIFPDAPLIFKLGNLYGTTQRGGTGRCSGGCGAVFEVSP
jgi:hypothetical protein